MTRYDLTEAARNSGEEVASWDQLSPPKTPDAVLDVPIMPALVRRLAAHKLASQYAGDRGLRVRHEHGTPYHYRSVTSRALEPAVARAGLNVEGRPRLRWQDLRDSFASMLIAQGHDVALVSKLLGHARVSVTLDTYTHMFDPSERVERARETMEGAFGTVLG